MGLEELQTAYKLKWEPLTAKIDPALLEAQLSDAREMIRRLPGMYEFLEVVVEILEVHCKKNADYTGTSGDPLFNFMWTAGFNHTNLKASFRHHEGNKISRMIALDSVDETAHNEAMQDTLSDLAVYLILEIAARRRTQLMFFETVDTPTAFVQLVKQENTNGES